MESDPGNLNRPDVSSRTDADWGTVITDSRERRHEPIFLTWHQRSCRLCSRPLLSGSTLVECYNGSGQCNLTLTTSNGYCIHGRDQPFILGQLCHEDQYLSQCCDPGQQVILADDPHDQGGYTYSNRFKPAPTRTRWVSHHIPVVTHSPGLKPYTADC